MNTSSSGLTDTTNLQPQGRWADVHGDKRLAAVVVFQSSSWVESGATKQNVLNHNNAMADTPKRTTRSTSLSSNSSSSSSSNSVKVVVQAATRPLKRKASSSSAGYTRGTPSFLSTPVLLSANKTSVTTQTKTPSPSQRATAPPPPPRACRSSPHSPPFYATWAPTFQSFLHTHGFWGSMLIRGLNHDGDEDDNDTDNDGDEDDNDNDDAREEGPPSDTVLEDGAMALLTKTTVDRLRYILIQESRADKLQVVQELIFLGRHNHSTTHQHLRTTPLPLPLPLPRTPTPMAVLEYDQHGTFGRAVYQAFRIWNKDILYQVKDPSQRLDWLIAFTWTIHEYDAWMYDHPEAQDNDLEVMVKSLGGTWQRLFLKVDAATKRSGGSSSSGGGCGGGCGGGAAAAAGAGAAADQLLGWDREYTQPGVMELLAQFQTKVAAYPVLGTFAYR